MQNLDAITTITNSPVDGPQPAQALSAADVELMCGMATLLTDAIPAFAVAVARLVHDQLDELPKDPETVESTRRAAEGNPREVLSMLRANLPPTAHETPVEAVEHVRFMQRRGVGWTSFLGIYRYGAFMFRNMIHLELDAHVSDPAQRARIKAAGDEYLFAYLRKVSTRLAVEYGLLHEVWDPASDDLMSNPISLEGARALREEQIANGTWIAATPEQSQAKHEVELAMEAFAATIEQAATASEVGRVLALANTTVTITLADEEDLSVTLLLDRKPIEVVDGVADAESRIWIASVDLNRIWSKGFYLPMAITRGRVRMDGTVRPFLRIVPVLRALAKTHDEIVASMESREAR